MVYVNLNLSPVDVLGNWCLKGWQRAWYFRLMQGDNHGNPMSGNHPCRQLPTGTITLKPYQWKNTYLTPILTKRVLKLQKGREGWELESFAHQQIDPQWSAWISKDFYHSQAKCHNSEGEAPSPWDHVASCHMRVRSNPLTPVRHKPATSIGLTLPQLH